MFIFKSQEVWTEGSEVLRPIPRPPEKGGENTHFSYRGRCQDVATSSVGNGARLSGWPGADGFFGLMSRGKLAQRSPCFPSGGGAHKAVAGACMLLSWQWLLSGCSEERGSVVLCPVL